MPNWLANLFKRPAPVKDALGDRGENVAEIDIIAREGKTLVFVEVKTRAYDDPSPEEQVNPEKRQQIQKAAKYYLSRYGFPQPPARFDVIAIVWPTGREPMIRHTPSAFDAS